MTQLEELPRPAVSASQISTFKTCRRKWYLQYVELWKRKDEKPSVARDSGTMVHAALEAMYKAGGAAKPGAVDLGFAALEAMRTDAITTLLARGADEKHAEESFKTAFVIYSGYVEWVNETLADADYVWTGFEQEYRTASPVPGVDLYGIMDMDGRRVSTNELTILDTKTTDQVSTMIAGLSSNEQANLYACMALILNPETKGFSAVWNIMKRRRSDKGSGPYYQRYELYLTRPMLRKFWERLHGTISDMVRLSDEISKGASHNHRAYPTPGQHCGWCDYRPLCDAMNDPEYDIEWLAQSLYVRKERRSLPLHSAVANVTSPDMMSFQPTDQEVNLET